MKLKLFKSKAFYSSLFNVNLLLNRFKRLISGILVRGYSRNCKLFIELCEKWYKSGKNSTFNFMISPLVNKTISIYLLSLLIHLFTMFQWKWSN